MQFFAPSEAQVDVSPRMTDGIESLITMIKYENNPEDYHAMRFIYSNGGGAIQNRRQHCTSGSQNGENTVRVNISKLMCWQMYPVTIVP